MTQDNFFNQFISNVVSDTGKLLEEAKTGSEKFFGNIDEILKNNIKIGSSDSSNNNISPPPTEPANSTTRDSRGYKLVLPGNHLSSSSNLSKQSSSGISKQASSLGSSKPLSTQGSSSSSDSSQKSSSGISKQALSLGSSKPLSRQESFSSSSSQQSSSITSQASSSGSSSKTMKSTKSSEDSRRSYMPRMPNLGILKALSMTKTYLSNGLSYMYENSPTLWKSKDTERSSPARSSPRKSSQENNKTPSPRLNEQNKRSMFQSFKDFFSGRTALNYQILGSYNGKVIVEAQGSTTLPQATTSASNFLVRTASGIGAGAKSAASTMGRVATSISRDDAQTARNSLGRTMSRSASWAGRSLASTASFTSRAVSSVSRDDIKTAGNSLGRTMSRSARWAGRSLASTASSTSRAAASIDTSGVRSSLVDAYRKLPSTTAAASSAKQMLSSVSLSASAWLN